MDNSKYFRPAHADVTTQMWDRIDQVIKEHMRRPGAITQVLRISQDVIGYLPVEVIDYVAQGLNQPRCDAYGIASFYSLFSLQPKGRHLIKVCAGTACYVKGIKEVLTRISQIYSLEDGGTTEDRRFSLETVRCLGACGLAPAMVVDQKTYGSVTPDKVIKILQEYE